MKRSEINTLIENAKKKLDAHYIKLPPFAYWSPAEWRKKGSECNEIRACGLGWDVTDFGSGDFDGTGLVVFTVRNGHHTYSDYTAKTYGEKVLVIQNNQHTPMHFHRSKMEDIINRWGGTLIVKVFNSDASEKCSAVDVTVSLDGVSVTVPAGSCISLRTGESITIPPYLYHEFWAQTDGDILIAWEVSKVNDDNADNRFLNKIGRFPDIEEDCCPLHYLCNEYPS